jgi:hypothetical protein
MMKFVLLIVLLAQITSIEIDLTNTWLSGDIGAIGDTPGAGLWSDQSPIGLSAADVLTLSSSAPNVTGTSDNFRYACRSLAGDASMTARVGTMTGADFAQGGVMVRNSLAPDSQQVFVFRFPTSNNIQRKQRPTPGAVVTSATTGLPGNVNTWLRLTRTGNSFATAISSDGQLWQTPLSPITIEMAPTAFWCLATTSVVGQEAVQAVATIDQLSLTRGEAPSTEPPPVDPPTEPVGDSGGLRPHYQGFGANSLGGAGDTNKTICIVTNRANTAGAPTSSGNDAHGSIAHYHGTFNQCATGMDTSYVLFDVSGYLELSGCRSMVYPYMTIAGQTAPPPGIALRNGCPRIDNRDIVVQHVRVRCGGAMGSVTGFLIRGQNNPVYNTVLDHVSASWCGAGGFNVNVFIGGTQSNYQQPRDTLIVDSISAEQLGISANQGYGSLTYGRSGATLTMARTYFAQNGNRTPWISSGMRSAYYNILTYNPTTVSGVDGTWGFTQIVGTQDYAESPAEVVYIGNVARPGPATIDPDGTVMIQADQPQLNAGGFKVYLADNQGPGITGSSVDGQWAGVSYQDEATRANSECNKACFDGLTWFHDVKYHILPSSQVEAYLDAHVGAYPAYRDALDTRLLGDKTDGDTSRIDHENEVGGFASVPLANNTRTVVIPPDPFGVGNCGTKTSGVARSVIECWLEQDPTFGARRIETAPTGAPASTNRQVLVRVLLVVLGLLAVGWVLWKARQARPAAS